MSVDKTYREPWISRNRFEALFDGIFAFAMTLLVTGLAIPALAKAEAATTLPARVMAMRPEFMSFIIAFFVLASFWLAHHRQFRFVQVVDPWIVRITLIILAFTVLMPFTTSLSGDYPDVVVAVDLFHANMFAMALMYLVHWYYLVRHPALTSGISRRDAANGLRRNVIVPFVSLAGIALAGISPSWSMAVYALIPGAFFLAGRYWYIRT